MAWARTAAPPSSAAVASAAGCPRHPSLCRRRAINRSSPRLLAAMAPVTLQPLLRARLRLRPAAPRGSEPTSGALYVPCVVPNAAGSPHPGLTALMIDSTGGSCRRRCKTSQRTVLCLTHSPVVAPLPLLTHERRRPGAMRRVTWPDSYSGYVSAAPCYCHCANPYTQHAGRTMRTPARTLLPAADLFPHPSPRASSYGNGAAEQCVLELFTDDDAMLYAELDAAPGRRYACCGACNRALSPYPPLCLTPHFALRSLASSLFGSVDGDAAQSPMAFGATLFSPPRMGGTPASARSLGLNTKPVPQQYGMLVACSSPSHVGRGARGAGNEA